MATKIHIISLASGLHPDLNKLFLNYSKRMRRFSTQHHLLDLDNKDMAKQHLYLEKKIQTLSAKQNKKVVLLKEQGQQFDTMTFAKWVNVNLEKSNQLFFVIGSHQGFSTQTINQYPESISLSPMTFPHQIVPLICLEQLYRAETLIENKPYHY